MTLDEIRKNKPDGATHYLINNHINTIFFLKKEDDKWLSYYNYDCGEGWGLCNQESIVRNMDNIKPLY